MTRVRVSSYFKMNMIKFIDVLIEWFPQETDLIDGKIYLETMCSDKKLIDLFIEFVVPFGDHILNKNEAIFIELKQTEYFGKIVSIWSQSSKEIQEFIWGWFGAFLKISNRYLAINL